MNKKTLKNSRQKLKVKLVETKMVKLKYLEMAQLPKHTTGTLEKMLGKKLVKLSIPMQALVVVAIIFLCNKLNNIPVINYFQQASMTIFSMLTWEIMCSENCLSTTEPISHKLQNISVLENS